MSLADLPACALPELRRPRHSLYTQRLSSRLAPLRACWLAWGACMCSSLAWQQPLPPTFDSDLRQALGLLLAASAGYSLLACSARDSWGGQSPAQDELLWPPGQAGEQQGQAVPLPEVGPSARPHATRPLRIVVLTVGTRGDVQPYIALGQHLREVGGHAVTIASSLDHQALVEGAGLAFAGTGIPKVEQPAHWLQVGSVAGMIEATGERLAADYPVVAASFLAAVAGGGAPADVIIGTSMTLTFALNIGEALGIPAWTAKLAPDNVTAAFPLPGGAPSALGWVNWLQGLGYWLAVTRAVSRTRVSAAEDEFRTASLGLPAVDPWARLEAMQHTPQLLGFSRALFPAPLDYPPHAFQCGFWLNADSGGGLYDPHAGLVAPALRAYVEAPEAPALVCVTLGSMENGPLGTLQLIVASCLGRGLRVVVVSGGMGGAAEAAALAPSAPPERLFCTPSAPHAYLFPRCVLVVHHGGAGTTARALACGVPSLIVPVLRWSDQMLWGELVERRGVGIVLREAAPGAGEVSAALQALLPPRRPVRDAASRVGAELRGERSCAVAGSLLVSCLCRLSLPEALAEAARACNGGGRGRVSLEERNAMAAGLSAVQRMCVRHCVPCNAWRRGVEGPRGGAPVFPNSPGKRRAGSAGRGRR